MNIKTNTKYINAAFFMLCFAIGIYASIFQSTISSIAKSYNVSGIYIGFFVTVHFIGGLLGSVVVGELGDRTGKKNGMLLSIIITVVGISFILLIRNMPILYIGIFIVGFGLNGLNSVVSSAISDTNRGREVKYMNIVQAMYCFGTIIGPLLVLAFVRLENWRVIYPPVAVLFLILLIYTAYLGFGGKTTEESKTGKKIVSFELIKKPSYMILCAVMFLYVGTESGTTYWMGSYFSEVFGNGQTGILLLSFFWGGMMVGRLVVSRYHYLESRFLFGGVILSFIFTLVWQFSNSIILVTFGITMTGVCFAPVFCAILTKATTRYPDATGSAVGMAITLGSLGGVAVPFLMGVITQKLSVRAAFLLVPILLFALLAMLLYDVYLQKSKQNS